METATLDVFTKLAMVAEHLTVTGVLLMGFWLTFTGKLRFEREISVIVQRAITAETLAELYKTERNQAFDKLNRLTELREALNARRR